MSNLAEFKLNVTRGLWLYCSFVSRLAQAKRFFN